jgi:hypothetical protein
LAGECPWDQGIEARGVGRRGCGIGERGGRQAGKEAREGGIGWLWERAEVNVCLGLGNWSGVARSVELARVWFW